MSTDKIDRYEIVRELGRGAMGVVYEAYDSSIDRKVAIKTLHTHALNSSERSEYLARFESEVKSAAKCMHPNIVTIMDFGQQDDMPYMVMEYIDGKALDELLNGKSTISLKQLFRYMGQLLSALKFAHKHNIIHRDIKPANIMITDDDRIKLMDFGVAQMPQQDITQAGMVVGTLNYMPPEQATGEKVDQRTDLYAMSVVFFHMMGLIPRYPALQWQEVSPKPDYPAYLKIDFSKTVPGPLSAMFSKALQADPNDRFQSADAYLQALQQTLAVIKSLLNKDNVNQQAAPPSLQEEQFQQSLTELEKMLTGYLGPIASRLIKSEATKVQDLTTLAENLAGNIPNEDEKKAFLAAWKREFSISGISSLSSMTSAQTAMRNSGSSAQSNSMNNQATMTAMVADDDRTVVINNTPEAELIDFSQEQIEGLKSCTANYMGPMAARIVSGALKKHNRTDELLSAIAAQIPNDGEREEFLSSAEALFSNS